MGAPLASIQVVRGFQLLPNNTVRYPILSDPPTVLSIQPDGSVDTRPDGKEGSYETFTKTDKGLLFSPLNNDGPSYIIPYVD
jgi:hypothetical protein